MSTASARARLIVTGSVGSLLGLLLATALLTACSQNPPAKAAAPAAAAKDAEPAIPKATSLPQTPPPAAPTSPVGGAYPDAPKPPRAGFEPPDGVWLTDDNGSEFYIEKLKRYEGKYKWIDQNRVNYMGIKIDVVDADDDWFYMKTYRVKEWDRSVKREAPTPEQVAAVAEQYKASTPTSDVLQFQAYDRGLPGSGQWRNGLVLADMNGDGRLDIVHGPPRKGGTVPIIFLGDGAGGWQIWREARFPRGYDYGDIAVGDLNGDGHQDIVLGIHLRGIRALIGDGKGNFTEWSEGIEYSVPGQSGDVSGFSSRALRLVDWDGDGKLDILALGEGPRVGNPTSAERQQKGLGAIAFVADGPVVYLNQGDGTWVKKTRGTDLQQLFGDDIDVGDFNHDRRIDFVTASNRMGRQDLVNLGQADDDWAPERMELVRPSAYIRAVSAVDLDRDGRDDLVVGYLSYELGTWRNGLDLLYARADGQWERKPLYSREGRVALYSIDHGDLDGDKVLDLAAVDADGDMYIFLGDGKGGFTREISGEVNQLRGKCRGYRVRLADLDGDGRDEVVINYADEASAMFDPQRCLSGGGLAAVKAMPRSAR